MFSLIYYLHPPFSGGEYPDDGAADRAAVSVTRSQARHGRHESMESAVSEHWQGPVQDLHARNTE